MVGPWREVRGSRAPVVPGLRRTIPAKRLVLLFVMAAWLAANQPLHAQTVSPRRLVEVADIGPPVVSPDGRYVAFRVEQASVERNAHGSAWYVQGMEDSAHPVRVGDGGVPLRDSAGISLPARAEWSHDGRWIYYRALLDGRIEVWRAAIDGSGASPVTSDPADVQEFHLSADGHELRYRVGATREEIVAAEQAEYAVGTRVDGNVPLGQGFYRSGFVAGRLATQRFGEVWFDRASLLADAPQRWMVIRLAEGGRGQPFAAEDEPAAIAVPGKAWKFSREPRTGRVALLTRVGERNGLRDKPGVELSVLSDRAGRAVRCTDRYCVGRAITSLQWRPGGDEVLFTVTDPDEGLAQSLYRWNVGTGAVRSIVQGRGLINGGRDASSHCGASARALVCVVAEAEVPPRLERIGIEDGERHVMFQPNAALAHDMRQVSVRLLRWVDAKGTTFTGQYFPASLEHGESRAPLFVSYYRCHGFLRGGMGDEWPLASLALRGIAALCINAAPYRIDALERYGNGLSATESVVDLLAKRGDIDPARVGFGGLSFGSEVALWLATESDLLAAISASSPAISPNYYVFNMLKGERFRAGLGEYWQLGEPDETPARWREISPTYRMDRIKAPVLFQMSEQEFRHAVDYVVPLVDKGRADAWVFPNAPHQKFEPKHKLAVYERNLDWFRFWLQGVEDPAPGKARQYERWRAMRDSQRIRTAELANRRGDQAW